MRRAGGRCAHPQAPATPTSAQARPPPSPPRPPRRACLWGQPSGACVSVSPGSRSSVGSAAAAGSAPHSPALENWSAEAAEPAASSRQEIDLPSPPARSRAGTGKGWGPAWTARTRGSQRARVGRKGRPERVDGGGGGRSEKAPPGIDCSVPRGGRQLGAAAPKWRALLCWKGVLRRAGLQEVPVVTPGQATSCVCKYR